MRQYLEILANTITYGQRQENRTGIDTFAVANEHFSHNMADGFPLLTTKKMAIKAIRVELEGFIGGITDKKWYEDRGCNIWKQWANPEAVEQRLDVAADEIIYDNFGNEIPNFFDKEKWRKSFQQLETDLGPFYGYQWRRAGVSYEPGNMMLMEGQPVCPVNEILPPHKANYDQLATIVDRLHNNPNDRRLVCSAWSPGQLGQMALPPCHLLFVLTHIDGVLSLHWTQRSCDLMLGVPFNIASYALLLELLAKEGGMKAGNLSGMLCNCHIYENQMEAAYEQLSREPLSLPQITITDFTSIFDWQHKDFELLDYNHLGKIDFGEVAV